MNNLPVNPIVQENLLGSVSESRPASVKIRIESEAMSSGKARIGKNILLVQNQNHLLFGTLSAVFMTPEGPAGSVELSATVDLFSGVVGSGVAEPPMVASKIYLCPPEIVKYIIENEQGDKQAVTFNMGRLPHNPQTLLRFTPERLFGRHLAIIGTSGSGKSWSTARLLEECSRYNSKAILLDATGEYHTLQDGVRHVYIGEDPSNPSYADAVTLPYYHLNQSDLFGIFQPRGQSQAAKLRSAIESLKLAKLAPHLAPDGTIIKAHKSKMDFQNESRRFLKKLEDPRAMFDIGSLIYQIRHECIDSQRSPTEPYYWGGHNSVDYSYCVPLINRIQDILQSPSLAPIFAPGKTRSLFDEMTLFLRDDRYKILRINLKYLSFAYSAREIVANAIGRHLMDMARFGAFKRMPLLILIDEAHQFLNNTLVSEEESFPLDSYALIAKEGRKYAINIVLATQRPRDIPEEVLSQMGTLVVHRLINDNDRKIVERASGEMDSASAASIPVLGSGEAILLGVDFPVPLSIKMEPPLQKPDSEGPNYQKQWCFK